MNTVDYSKITVLIIAKLLQHEDPITANEIAEYVNHPIFKVRDKITVKQVAGMIRKYNRKNQMFGMVTILRGHFREEGVRNGYVIKNEYRI